MLVPIRPCHALASAIRSISSSSRTCNLVAPPDPVSHMRPIIYSDVPPPPAPSYLHHPYSLDEFSTVSKERDDLALQFRFQRQQLDDFHQNFWFDVRLLCCSNHGLNEVKRKVIRATHVLKPRNKLSSQVSHRPPRLWIKKEPCQSSIRDGICRKHIGQMLTQGSGDGETSHSSNLALAWRSNSLPTK